ncbi:MFS transporter [Actinorhabdospora filicis]|uniref:MFS transporter n=1 Tax=Actinorhabdospora filicis TaxID=1785913 RepID=UPI00255224C6|nr:MFS transporter [Actinorhabdospora filicis]
MNRPRRPSALRGSPAFRRLWGAHLISSLGSGITGLAIPLLAAVTLHASPAAIGALTAVSALPHVLLSLPAGVLVDRAPQRAVLILTDFGRALCLGLVPILGLLGLLSMPVLYGVVFLVQAQTVVYDLASASTVPKVLPPRLLAAGNSAIAVNGSAAAIAGSGLGGGLVQLIGAAFAVAVDAVSYLLSGLLLLFLRSPELAAARITGRRGVLGDIRSGLAHVLKDRVLVALCLSSGLGAFAVAMRDASLVLALVRELHFTAATVGLLAVTAGVGGILGGLLADRVARRFGFGRSVITAVLTGAAAIGLLAAPFGTAPAVVVGVGQFVGGLSGAVYTIGQLTMRQLATPPGLLGRVNAARRFLVYASLPLGAMAGGLGGAALGSRSMLLIAAVVMLIAVIPLLAAGIGRDVVEPGAVAFT